MDTPGGAQQFTIINEPGLYSVIPRSDKPQAKDFKRWVTHEVLPSIRKTGAYGQDNEKIKAVAEAQAQLHDWQALEMQFKAYTEHYHKQCSDARKLYDEARIQRDECAKYVALYSNLVDETIARLVDVEG